MNNPDCHKKPFLYFPFYGLLLMLIFTCAKPRGEMNQNNLTFLALGDSYTIGEAVLPAENFPNQTVQLLKQSGYNFEAPEVVAKTGWTTDELQTAVDNHIFFPPYNFVSLLIGVNNQYRGRTADDYKPQFENLLKQAIQFAGGNANHVFVLSIPDWGATHFAEGRDRDQIAKEIDEYNYANKEISNLYGVNYIDITLSTRQAIKNKGLLSIDGLHPSKKEYAKWSKTIADSIYRKIFVR